MASFHNIGILFPRAGGGYKKPALQAMSRDKYTELHGSSSGVTPLSTGSIPGHGFPPSGETREIVVFITCWPAGSQSTKSRQISLCRLSASANVSPSVHLRDVGGSVPPAGTSRCSRVLRGREQRLCIHGNSLRREGLAAPGKTNHRIQLC